MGTKQESKIVINESESALATSPKGHVTEPKSPQRDSILRSKEKAPPNRLSSFLSDNRSTYNEKVDVDKVMKFVHTTKNACK